MQNNIIPCGAASVVTISADTDLSRVVYARITIEARQKTSRFEPEQSVSISKETPDVVIDGNTLCVQLTAEETAYLGSLDPNADAALYLQALCRDCCGQEMTSRIMEGRLQRRLHY